MARKTYLSEMYAVNRKAYKYMSRWRDKYYDTLTSEQKDAVQDAINALQALLPLIKPAPPTPG
jgi:hypothetical protein